MTATELFSSFCLKSKTLFYGKFDWCCLHVFPSEDLNKIARLEAVIVNKLGDCGNIINGTNCEPTMAFPITQLQSGLGFSNFSKLTVNFIAIIKRGSRESHLQITQYGARSHTQNKQPVFLVVAYRFLSFGAPGLTLNIAIKVILICFIYLNSRVRKICGARDE